MKEGRHNKYVGKEMNIQLPVVIVQRRLCGRKKDHGDRMVIVSIVVIVSQA